MKKHKNSLLLSIYCLYIVFLSAACSDFANGLQAQIIFVFLSVYLLFKKSNRWMKDKTGFLLVICSIIILLIHFLSSSILVLGAIKFFIIIITVYYIIRQFHYLFLDRLMSVIYYLSIITVPFYLLQIIDIELLKYLIEPFNFSYEEQASFGGIYIYVFNLNPIGGIRNSGFMWEPGAYGGMLLFVLVYFYFRSNYKISRKFAALFLYSLTTFSTTTYIGLFLLLLLILIGRFRNNLFILSVSIASLVFIGSFIYSLPFMGEKINEKMETNVDYNTVYSKEFFREGQSIGRFAGLLLELDRIKEKPLLGYGWNFDYSTLGLGNDWTNPSGLAVLLGRFGIIGILFIFWGLYYTWFFYKSKFNKIVVMVVLLLPLFSNPFQFNIVFWSYVMLGLVNKTALKNNRSPYLCNR